MPALHESAIRIAVVATTFVLIAVFGAVVGRNSSPATRPGTLVVGYKAWFRGTGPLSILLALALSVGLLIESPPDRTELFGLIALAAAFGFGGVAVIGEGVRTKWVLTADGIGKLPWLTRHQFIAWSEVEQVYHGKLDDWVFRGSGDDRKIVVSNHTVIDRFDWIVEACRAHLPPDKYPSQWVRDAKS